MYYYTLLIKYEKTTNEDPSSDFSRSINVTFK